MSSINIWQVRVPKRVAKIIKCFPKREISRIQEALRGFEVDPWTGDISKIKGEENKWRRRVGNYRLYYSVRVEIKVIEITHIERRASSTY